ncbi:hypothetical protein JZ751_027800 [Albula glossodonta]|uniref:O-methyltransferase dimerisation domain-containing protein n=1 Tax=Albula glossodonta TaxID=121402 RepID=A0A8T2PK88_9TELE|nr:hypothetical protein JZ751_027800 [Albula glossodonta]
MSSSNDVEYPRKILDYMEGFLVSKTLFASCELGVYDFLLASERPLSAAEVAQGLGISEDGADRLLSACAGLKLLTAQISDAEVLYSNTEMSTTYLTKSSPQSLYHSIQYNSKTIYLCWHYLTDAVREGKNQYEKAFGVSSKDLFEALYSTSSPSPRAKQSVRPGVSLCCVLGTAYDMGVLISDLMKRW